MSMNKNDLLLEFNENIKFDYNLKKRIGLISVEKLKSTIKQKI